MAHIVINANRSKGTINKNIYGHFSEHLGRCIYEGLFAGKDEDIPNVNGMRSDVVETLKSIDIPVLRWPGGCFADTYHWMDGIGPQSQRKTIVNTNWGGVTEDNSFGTHEFMELVRQLGCEAYFSGNVGSGTVQEFSDWVEYCNMGGISPMADLRRSNGQDRPFNVKYWGIGNEAWGCGGNMNASYYADECRKYATYLRNYDPEHTIYKIASGASDNDYNWTKIVAEKAGSCIDALSLHHYSLPTSDWKDKGSATEFGKDQYFSTLKNALWTDELIENHTRVIREVRKDKKLGLVVDEWGTWYNVEPGTEPGFLYQQNSVRDAIVAGLSLNIFNDHCDSVVMANIAQTVNVLQAMVLTEGSRMVVTPTCLVFGLYKGHQNARQLESYAETAQISEQEIPDITVSASEKYGEMLVTVVNTDPDSSKEVNVILGGCSAVSVSGKGVYGDMHTCNTFDAPEAITVREISAKLTEEGFDAVLPPCSVCAFTVKLA